MRGVSALIAMGTAGLALAACSAPVKPTNYVSKQWGFSATFQAKPKVTLKKAAADGSSPASILVEANAGGDDFSVNVLDASGATATPDQMMADTPNVLANAMGVDVGTATDVAVDGVAGREVTFMKNDKPVMLLRIYYENGKLYEVSANSQKGPSDPAVASFLNSFHLTEPQQPQPGTFVITGPSSSGGAANAPASNAPATNEPAANAAAPQ